jgi:hypothetical protein
MTYLIEGHLEFRSIDEVTTYLKTTFDLDVLKWFQFIHRDCIHNLFKCSVCGEEWVQPLSEAEVEKHCLAHGKFAVKNKSFRAINSLFAWLAKEHNIHIKKACSQKKEASL